MSDIAKSERRGTQGTVMASQVPIPTITDCSLVAMVNKPTKLSYSVCDSKLKVQYGVRKRSSCDRVEGIRGAPRTKN